MAGGLLTVQPVDYAMSATSIKCPHCQGTMTCDESEIGLTAHCPLCSSVFKLALISASAPQKPTPLAVADESSSDTPLETVAPSPEAIEPAPPTVTPPAPEPPAPVAFTPISRAPDPAAPVLLAPEPSAIELITPATSTPPRSAQTPSPPSTPATPAVASSAPEFPAPMAIAPVLPAHVEPALASTSPTPTASRNLPVTKSAASASPLPANPDSAPARPPASPQSKREPRSTFLARIRAESSYPALRSILKTMQTVGCAMGGLAALVGGYLTFAAIKDSGVSNLMPIAYGVGISGGGLLCIALSLAAYQAAVLVVDIADIGIDQRA